MNAFVKRRVSQQTKDRLSRVLFVETGQQMSNYLRDGAIARYVPCDPILWSKSDQRVDNINLILINPGFEDVGL